MSSGERASWIVTLVGLLLVLAPWMFAAYDRALGDAAFALLLAGALSALTAFITVFFLRDRDRYRRALLADSGVLAHWRYSEEEWRTFAGEDRRRQAGEQRSLLTTTAVIMLVVALPFVIFDRAAGWWVAATLCAVWSLCWIVARVSVRSQAASRRRSVREVRIGKNALLLGNELHVWRGWGNVLDDCAVRAGSPPFLVITYSAPPGRGPRRQLTVGLPIPPGREAEAAAVRRQLAARTQGTT